MGYRGKYPIAANSVQCGAFGKRLEIRDWGLGTGDWGLGVESIVSFGMKYLQRISSAEQSYRNDTTCSPQSPISSP
jgi:hypothetical protein